MRVLTKPTDALKDRLFFRCSPEMTADLRRAAKSFEITNAQLIRTAIAHYLGETKFLV